MAVVRWPKKFDRNRNGRTRLDFVSTAMGRNPFAMNSNRPEWIREYSESAGKICSEKVLLVDAGIIYLFGVTET